MSDHFLFAVIAVGVEMKGLDKNRKRCISPWLIRCSPKC